MRIDKAITHIEQDLAEEFENIDISVMTKRKIIKLVIISYSKFVADLLANGIPYTFKYIGRLIPYKRKVGAGKNPFTGKTRSAKLINTLKFKIASSLKERI